MDDQPEEDEWGDWVFRAHFGESGLFDKSYRGLVEQISFFDLIDVTNAFTGNCNRVFELSATHVNLVVYSLFMARHDTEIRIRHDIPHSEPNPDAIPEYAADMADAWKALLKDRQENELHWEQWWEIGASYIDRYIANATMPATGSMGLLASMVISGWMCFECLAVDLWKLMVNQYPNPLARNILKGQPLGIDGIIKDQKSISLSTLDRYQFDLSSCMGEVLVDNNKVFLGSLSGIVSAYQVAFGSEFDPSIIQVDALKRLEAMRNLFAHRGGLVDETFMRRMKDVPMMVPLQVGQNFSVRGNEVRDYMNVVVESGSALILFADRWMNEKSGGTAVQGDLGL